MTLRRLPIHMRLAAIGVVSSAVVALVVSIALGSYVVLTFRETLIRNLTVQANMLGYNVTTALLFDDRESARRTLAALSADGHIVSAAVYTADGEVFSTYTRIGSVPREPPAPEPLGRARVDSDRLVLSRPILFERETIGVVTIESDLGALDELITRIVATAATVFLAALLLSYFISRRLERGISRPILALTDLARRVTEVKDYSGRAPEEGPDEIAALGRAFNDMLGQIRERERELRSANESLEQRVLARTAQLEATNRELEAFSYSVSHDLRAPLRSVVGFAEIARTHGAAQENAPLLRHLDKIVEAARRMGELIDHLLVFSRMGRTALEVDEVDLAALVREIRQDLAPETTGRDIEWKVGGLPRVRGDRAMLRLALTNLLSNAVKYTRPRARAIVEIEARPQDDEMVVSVRDNGVGFDMAYSDKLFGVFSRLHRSDEFEGTGIGLANVQRIVQRHGGRVWAHGAVDRGATFYFTLPAVPGPVR